jgi:predicted metal-dependent phosphoesterase TrpH
MSDNVERKMRVDLHIHSSRSDGKYSPSKIVEYSVKNRLDVISITDHDTIEGFREARKATRTVGSIELVSGVEFSTWLDHDELHILGYGIDETHPGLLHLLEIAQVYRKKRMHNILKKLSSIGIQISVEDVKNKHSSVSLGRMHVACVLIERGYVRTVREAFERYLSYEANLIKQATSDFISSGQAVEIILEAGGIPVLAHPTIKLFDQYIDVLIECGLKGVEVFKNTRTSIEEFYLETVVRDKGLLVTGGSDWHGYHFTRPLGSFYVESGQIQPFLKAVHLS